jgi:hypothetical protein
VLCVVPVAVYEVVKRKEAEKRAEAKLAAEGSDSPSFGELVKQQWEQKKTELGRQ